MRPISKNNFGSKYGSLSVRFHNGTAVVTGFIVRQVGTTRYEVSDGRVTKICSLAKTEDEANNLGEGSMSIATSGGKFITKLTANHAKTTDTEVLTNWKSGEEKAVSFPSPTYKSTVEYIRNTTLPAQFTKNPSAATLTLHSGSGNPATNMLHASNGELMISGAVRRYRNGTTFPAGEENKYTLVLNSDQDWSYVYCFSLLTDVPGQRITDLYDVTMTITAGNGASVTKTMGVGSDGRYIHVLNHDDIPNIIDDAQPNFRISQNMQRVRFWEAALSGVSKNEFGSLLGRFDFVFKATPKRENPAQEVVLTFSVDASATPPA